MSSNQQSREGRIVIDLGNFTRKIFKDGYATPFDCELFQHCFKVWPPPVTKESRFLVNSDTKLDVISSHILFHAVTRSEALDGGLRYVR